MLTGVRRFALLLVMMVAGTASATVAQIQGNTVNGPSNCYPFGAASFGPYAGFIYKNIPAFNLNPGDKIAFDLGAVNDQTIVLDIAMAHTISSGSTQPDANGFTTVVSAGTPTGTGDTIKGNYDLVFTAQSAYSFPGGGLIIRFQAEGSFLSDNTCTQVLDWSRSTDTSGTFVARFYHDSDGVYPWTSTDTASIGIVRITTAVTAAANGPYSGVVGSPVALDASGSTSTGGAITTYEWDCTSDGTYDTMSASPTGASCTYSTAGSYTATLRATDSNGSTATATASVNVTAPVGIAPAMATIAPRGTVAFSAAGGSGAGYTFTLSTNASGASIDSASGAYTAGSIGNVSDVVTVTDSLGGSSTALVTVTAAVSLSPASPATPPLGTIALSASGGSGSGYVFALSTNASGGSIDAASGSFTAGPIGAVSDVVVVTDSLGNSATVNVSVGAGVSVSPAAPAVAPRGSVSFAASGGSGSFDYALTVNQSGGTISGTGQYTAGRIGSVSDVVTVTDSLGNTTRATISVGPALSMTPGAPSTAPNGSISFSVSGGSGVGYGWAITSNGSGGSVSPTGVYSAGSIGSVGDVVTVTDSLGNSASAVVNVGPGVTVSPSAPSTPPQGALSFSASGGSNAGFVWTIVANASGGSIDNSGAYAAGAIGGVTDVVRVVDSLGNVATTQVAVGPGVSITPASPTTPPRGALTFGALGGSGSGFVWAIATNGSGASIDASTGSYRAGATGASVDTVQVTDALGNVASVNVSVGAGIAINPGSASTPPLGGTTLSATGGSGSGYTWSLTANSSGGGIDPASGQYTAGAAGSTSDTVQVTDSLGNRATATVNVGPGLSISSAQDHLAPRGTLLFSVAGGSGSGYSWSLAVNHSGGHIDAAGGAYTAGPAPDCIDTVQATDSLGNQATATIAIGPALALSASSASVAPRGSARLSATGGSGGYVYSLAGNGSGGNINSSTGDYVAGPTPSVSDLVRAIDSNGNEATTLVSVGAGVSIAQAAPQTPPRGSLTFTASGGSGNGYVWGFATNASGGSIDRASGAYVAGAIGSVADLVRVIDSLGNSATVSVSVGDGLAANPATPTVAPRGTITLAVTGGSGGYRWSLSTNASGGTLDSATGVYTAGPTGAVTDVALAVDSVGNAMTIDIQVGAQLSVTTPNRSARSGDTAMFSVMGGSGNGYTWSLANNASGATIDSHSGLYSAGATSGVDIVRVVDSLGNQADARVDVTGAVSPPADAPDGGTPAGPSRPTSNTLQTGGCGCEVGGSTPAPAGLSILVAVALAALNRRRKGRSNTR